MNTPSPHEPTRFLVTLPLWVIIDRKTRNVATSKIAGVSGDIFAWFSEESFADEVAELKPGYDPYRVDALEEFRAILDAMYRVGCKWVAIDAGRQRGWMFKIEEVVASLG